MKTYEFGDEERPVMLLIPGTCCHWRIFDQVIPLLARRFRVIAVSFDGFDETEPDAVFPSVLEETEKIERLVADRFGGEVFAAYGCSLGGSLVALMVQRGRVHMDHAFIGSSDLDQAGELAARAQTAVVAPVLHRMLATGELPGFMRRRLAAKPPEERVYMERFLREFGMGEGARNMAFVSRRSIANQFRSDLTTPLAKKISAPGTRIHVFYAMKMGERYEDRYLEHFLEPHICRHDMNHEELLFAHPEDWCAEVFACCGV